MNGIERSRLHQPDEPSPPQAVAARSVSQGVPPPSAALPISPQHPVELPTAGPATAPAQPSDDVAALPGPVPEPSEPSNRAPAAGVELAEVQIARGDTLGDIMHQIGIDPGEAHLAIAELRGVVDTRRLQLGQTIALETEAADAGRRRLVSVALDVDNANAVRLERGDDGAFATTSVARDLRRLVTRAAGSIDGSLYAAAAAVDLPSQTTAEMVKALSWDVDFQRDVHPGDEFEVVYDRLTNEDGQDVRAEPPSFIGLELQGRTIAAYRHTEPDGSSAYYDADGNALRKWLLRTPIDGARLSSRFGPRRHPILGYDKMHKGLDFAASTGTPIFAAGDGTVETAGRNKGYGNYVRIRHDAQYATAYAHMSRFAKGLERGDRVRQGDVIGLVGSTGMSTGPHLHYEVLRDEEQINPLSLKARFAQRLEGDARRRFMAARREIDRARAEPPVEVAAREY